MYEGAHDICLKGESNNKRYKPKTNKKNDGTSLHPPTGRGNATRHRWSAFCSDKNQGTNDQPVLPLSPAKQTPSSSFAQQTTSHSCLLPWPAQRKAQTCSELQLSQPNAWLPTLRPTKPDWLWETLIQGKAILMGKLFCAYSSNENGHWKPTASAAAKTDDLVIQQ